MYSVLFFDTSSDDEDEVNSELAMFTEACQAAYKASKPKSIEPQYKGIVTDEPNTIYKNCSRRNRCFSFFQHKDDYAGHRGISKLVKCTFVIRQLTYGCVPDSLDEYLQMGAKTSRKCLKNFCKVIMNLYGEEFLRNPTYTDIKLYAYHNEKHVFPGMPDPFILLEAIASNDLWIWHTFFGVSEMNNDVNVLCQSPLFNDLKSGRASDVPFMANNVPYKRGYYLIDGIYPEWSVLIKSITNLEEQHRDDVPVRTHQESMQVTQEIIDRTAHLNHPTKDDACHHYKEAGHCKRNCPAYLAELIKKKKKQVGTARSSGMLNSWRKILSQEVSGRVVELEEIQDKYTLPSKNTSEIPIEVEGFKPPQEEVIPVRRSTRTHRAPVRLCLNIEVDAMNAKMQSKKDNQVWCLIDLPLMGYTQTYGLNYEETFSPVANIRAIRILIAIAGFYDYDIWQMDVKTAFSNGYLNKDIYMVQPESFVDPNHPKKFTKCKVYLGKCFAMKDLEDAAFILGIKIYRDRSKRLIRLSQSAYMDKILKRFRNTSKRDYIPMQERLDLNKTQGASTHEKVKCMQNVPYALANPGEPHWTAVKTILKYLRNTKDMFLVYGGNPEAELRVDCYCDAGFETNIYDTKSQT
uniref:Putative nuclease HARBI1 n=1 Tax=Tanacetum cinerariifolium TaxID=118510 RepID=A0A6L2NUS0_TANCI|nr:putative nuclease HARBI1 [Tanacetum cinerariifolium]